MLVERVKKMSIREKETTFMESNGQPYSLEITSCDDNFENPRLFVCCLTTSLSLAGAKDIE